LCKKKGDRVWGIWLKKMPGKQVEDARNVPGIHPENVTSYVTEKRQK
jgi:hypothetical protein